MPYTQVRAAAQATEGRLQREVAELNDHLDHLNATAGSSSRSQRQAAGAAAPPPALNQGSLTTRLLGAFGDLQATSARLHAMQVRTR